MTRNLSIIAMIPARGNSKGIKNKNLYPVLGKPLIQYTIEAALNSKYIDDIYINTEDDKIRSFCNNFPIQCDYIRPVEMAQDESPTDDCILDWINFVEQSNKSIDIIIILQPTSPLRTTELIDRAIKSFIDTPKINSLVGVHLMKEHPYKSIYRRKTDWCFLAHSEEKVTRRQDYNDNYFVINGSLYIADIEWYKKNKFFVSEGETELFITSSTEGIDIDEPVDILIAEQLIKQANIKKDV